MANHQIFNPHLHPPTEHKYKTQNHNNPLKTGTFQSRFSSVREVTRTPDLPLRSGLVTQLFVTVGLKAIRRMVTRSHSSRNLFASSG